MAAPLPMTRVRRVTLALGLPVALALIGLSSFTAIALADQASYRVHVSAPASGGQARVMINNADATVRPGPDGRISVSGTLRGSLSRPTFAWRSDASGLTLDSRCWSWAGTCSLAYDIAAPAGLPLTVSDGSGNLNVSGFGGHVTLSAGSGDRDASRLAGRISLSDGSGDITASGLDDGSVDFSNGSGNIVISGLAATDVVGDDGLGNITLTFTKVPKRVDVTDESGDITLVLPRGPTYYHVEASSASGSTSVSVNQRLSSPYVITASNGSGNITISY